MRLMKGLMMKKASPITLEKYLETAAPKAFGKMKRTWAVCRFPADAGENSPEFKQRREAHVQCRQVLLEGHEEGKFEVHGRNRGDLMSCFAVLDPDRQREVLEAWKYAPDRCPVGEVHLPDCGDVPVRVLSPEDVETVETNYGELLRNCTGKQVVDRAGKELINEGDERGPGFPRRVHERMGSPVKPPVDTVRKYVAEIFPDQKESCSKNK